MSAEKEKELNQLLLYLKVNGKNLSAINQAALFLQQKSYPLEMALKAYAGFLADRPDSAGAAFNQAWYLAKDGQFESAIKMYRRALELGIDRPEEAHLNIANIYMDHLHDNEEAKKEFQTALSINPRYVGAHHNLGNLAEQLGDRTRAAACFEKCLELEPQNELALARLADTHKFEESGDPLLNRLITATQTSNNCDLHFALGSAFNQLGNFDLAWQHFSKANALDKSTLPPYQRQHTEDFFDRIITQFDRDWFDRVQGKSSEAVFICGMFRTGSTLLEQILSAHPAFMAGGESEFVPRLVMREFHDFPEGIDEITPVELQSWKGAAENHLGGITGGAVRLTDKRPDNFLYIGLIKAMLPSAKFVVTERDWRDVALSIYSTRLGAAQNYATDLANIRHYIGQHKRLVDHWESILADDLMRVGYEDLVSKPREIVGGVLHKLGENWDDRCLSFDKQDNAVKTASVWQVREPLHSRSIGRWKNYQAYFKEI